jgi:voltage-gated sodium channel type V alpha
MIEAILKMIAY